MTKSENSPDVEPVAHSLGASRTAARQSATKIHRRGSVLRSAKP